MYDLDMGEEEKCWVNHKYSKIGVDDLTGMPTNNRNGSLTGWKVAIPVVQCCLCFSVACIAVLLLLQHCLQMQL